MVLSLEESAEATYLSLVSVWEKGYTFNYVTCYAARKTNGEVGRILGPMYDEVYDGVIQTD